jgi:hypothetical protein
VLLYHLSSEFSFHRYLCSFHSLGLLFYCIRHRLHMAHGAHAHATHSYLLRGENPPQCSICAAPLTVEHPLVTCSGLKRTLLQFFNEVLLPSVFSSVASRQIAAFIKIIGFIAKCELLHVSSLSVVCVSFLPSLL